MEDSAQVHANGGGGLVCAALVSKARSWLLPLWCWAAELLSWAIGKGGGPG